MNWASTKKLIRTKQCDSCPWKKGIMPEDITQGFDLEYYQGVREQFQASGLESIHKQHKQMACHMHPDSNPTPCVGWLINQAGIGNNLFIRLQLMQVENSCDLQVDGEQHNSILDFFSK